MNPLILFAIGIIFSGLAWGQASTIRPIDLTNLYGYVLIALMGVCGGAVSFYQKVKAKQSRWLNIHELIGELATSGFTGFLVGLVCQGLGVSLPLTFALVGIAGHAGSRALFLMENLAKAAAERRLGVKADDPEATAPGVK